MQDDAKGRKNNSQTAGKVAFASRPKTRWSDISSAPFLGVTFGHGLITEKDFEDVRAAESRHNV